VIFFSHRISFKNVCAAFCAPTCRRYSYTYNASFSLAWASDGAPDPFPLAYIALVEAGLFVLEDSNVMNVLVETEQRATSEGLSSA